MNMPPITKNLIIINLLFFLGTLVATRYQIDLNDLLGLHFFLASDFSIYQLLTYMFMHGSFEHILFNMFAVWMFGRVMEHVWGPKKFLLYYLICGIGAGITQEIVQYISYAWSGLADYDTVNLNGYLMSTDEYLNRWTTVGASGAVYGILLAFGMIFPEERMFIFPLPVPIKAKYFVIGYAAIELFSGITSSGDGIAHFAHLGGMVFGLALILYWRNGHGGSYYGNNGFMGRVKRTFHQFFDRFVSRHQRMKVYRGGRAKDYEFNAAEKDREKEIDRILEKVKKNGYGSLTAEEKRKLFDASQQ